MERTTIGFERFEETCCSFLIPVCGLAGPSSPPETRAGIPLYLLKRKACVNHIINTAEKVECRFGRNDRGSASRDKLSAKNLLRFVAPTRRKPRGVGRLGWRIRPVQREIPSAGSGQALRYA